MGKTRLIEHLRFIYSLLKGCTVYLQPIKKLYGLFYELYVRKKFTSIFAAFGSILRQMRISRIATCSVWYRLSCRIQQHSAANCAFIATQASSTFCT